ncbi:hypothetical protein DSOL_2582 [Desulfosporosinus metallidurans]|uniref:Uncharacterized protein n=1 Tax=Desulfosporosinus metallidurans TaxID=1888891 RepID=A0A1Q8QW30_9FIRM|nr:hypothetical protein DSOL_2582 [Desulfosporosinus metallidurans]
MKKQGTGALFYHRIEFKIVDYKYGVGSLMVRIGTLQIVFND